LIQEEAGRFAASFLLFCFSRLKEDWKLRTDNRRNNELRRTVITPHFLKHAEGSVLIEVGDTKVVCSASIEDKVPPFLRGTGKGWITAEYSMIPRATEQRTVRESSKGKISGRTMEIQRLIGRSLRSVVNLDLIGERTIWIDCDVIQADGGTRTAAITGSYVALVYAIIHLHNQQPFDVFPVTDFLAATSVGILKSKDMVLDLNYEEDSNAQVDMNIVMTGNGHFVEVQGTGEEATFTHEELLEMLALAKEGIQQLITIQKETLGDIAEKILQNKQ
jgi:ribonuclease PH